METTPQIIYKSFSNENVEVVDVENRTIRGYMSTFSPDRMNEVVLPEATQLKNYRANNIVLFNHRHDMMSVGTGNNIEKDSKGILVDTEFVKNVSFAEDLYQCYSQGAMKAFSIGFTPIHSKINKDGQRIYTNIELLEYSCVTIPMNAEALTKSLEIVTTPVLKEQFEYQIKSFQMEDRINELFESKKSLEDNIKNYSEFEIKIKEYENMNDKINQLQESMNQQNDVVKKINNDLQKLLAKELNKTKNKNIEALVIKAINKKLGVE